MLDKLTPENRARVDSFAARNAAGAERRARFGTKVTEGRYQAPVPRNAETHANFAEDATKPTAYQLEPLDALDENTRVIDYRDQLRKPVAQVESVLPPRSTAPVVPEELPGARAALSDEDTGPQSAFYWMNER